MLRPCEHCSRHIFGDLPCPFCASPRLGGVTTAALVLGLVGTGCIGDKSQSDYGASITDDTVDYGCGCGQ
jgi:hypothetical protein